MCDNSELSCNFLQWESMGVCDFPLIEIGGFFGINTDVRIDPNSIPYTVVEGFLIVGKRAVRK